MNRAADRTARPAEMPTNQPVLAEVGVDQLTKRAKVTANMKYIGIVTMNVFLFSFLSHAAIASRDERQASGLQYRKSAKS